MDWIAFALLVLIVVEFILILELFARVDSLEREMWEMRDSHAELQNKVGRMESYEDIRFRR